MKYYFKQIVIVLIILVSMGWLGYKHYDNKQKKAREKAERITKQEEITKKIALLSKKYGAIDNWYEEIEGKTDRFTIDFEKALIRKDGKAILIDGALIDIFTKDGTYFIKAFDLKANEHLEYILQCFQNHIDSINKEKSSQFGNYAIIAEIKYIEKAEYINEHKEAEPKYIAHGKCLDLMYIDF